MVYQGSKFITSFYKNMPMHYKKLFQETVKSILRLFIIFFLTSLSAIPAFTQDNWELVKEDEQIKVYLNKKQNNKHLTHVRASSTTNRGSLKDYYALMKNVDNYKSWMHGIKNIELLERENENEFTYYMLSDFPWPAKDRDIVINTKVHYEKNKNLVYTDAENQQNMVPEKEGIQRLKKMSASWSFEQINPETIKIKYEGKIYSSIVLPDWLKKHVSYIGPFNTIKNIKEEIGGEN